MAPRHKTSRGRNSVCMSSWICPRRNVLEGLQCSARLTHVKLGNIEWLSSTSMPEAGGSEDAAERALG